MHIVCSCKISNEFILKCFITGSWWNRSKTSLPPISRHRLGRVWELWGNITGSISSDTVAWLQAINIYPIFGAGSQLCAVGFNSLPLLFTVLPRQIAFLKWDVMCFNFKTFLTSKARYMGRRRPTSPSNFNKIHWFSCFYRVWWYLGGSSTEITYGELNGNFTEVHMWTCEPQWACARNPWINEQHLTHCQSVTWRWHYK